MHIRYNETSDLWEYLSSVGPPELWTKLPIDASQISGGSANIAYTDAANTFTQSQDITGGSGTDFTTAPLEIRTASTPRVSFHWLGVVASQIGIDNMGIIRTFNNSGTGYENFAANNFYEKARTTPVGHWINFIPVFIAGTLNQSLASSYMLIGKTLFINFYWNVTVTAVSAAVQITIPLGFISTGYTGVPFCLGATTGMAHTVPSGNILYLFKDLTNGNWPAGTWYVTGCIPISIQ